MDSILVSVLVSLEGKASFFLFFLDKLWRNFFLGNLRGWKGWGGKEGMVVVGIREFVFRRVVNIKNM